MAVLYEATVCKYGGAGIGVVDGVKFVAYVEWVMGLFGLDAEVAAEECCCELCQGGGVGLGCAQQYNVGIRVRVKGCWVWASIVMGLV